MDAPPRSIKRNGLNPSKSARNCAVSKTRRVLGLISCSHVAVADGAYSGCSNVPVGSSLRAGSAEGLSGGGVSLVGVAAQRGNCGEADDDNEGQHHGIFDSRRAVSVLEK